VISKDDVLRIVSDLYREEHPAQVFVPGESPVPVAGRVIDSQEVLSAVDAILDGWLTSGRFIEDNCDALGSRYGGKLTATFGDMATLSFYPAHHITTGEGGAVVTSDPLLSKILLSLRDWGRDCWCDTGRDATCRKRFAWKVGTLPFGYDHKYIYSHLGYNLKMTDIQAAIGIAQLEKLPAFINARQANWKTLREGLAELGDRFLLPVPSAGSEPSWFGFLLTVRPGAGFSRPEIIAFLEKNRIATRLLFAGNMVRQPAFQEACYRVDGQLSQADAVMERSFWLGVYPGITPAMLDHVIQSLKAFCRK
jgi:CDP-4-dehydro-6-deoxyglucose reductase, E1